MTLIRYVSDLHIRDKSKLDDFNAEEEFIHFCQDTIARGYSLRILGDAFDQELLLPIVGAYKRLLNELPDNTIFIYGNHDIWLKELNHLKGFRVFESYAEGSTILIHGHQFDEICKNISLSNFFIKLGNILEPLFPDIDNLQLQKRRPEIYITESAKFAKDRGYKRIIFGHTHCAGHWNVDGVEVYNTGCWVNGRRDYVEYVNGKYFIRSWGDCPCKRHTT